MERIGSIEGIRMYREGPGGPVWYMLNDVRDIVHKPRLTVKSSAAYVVIGQWPHARRWRLIDRQTVLDIMQVYDYEHTHRFWRDALK